MSDYCLYVVFFFKQKTAYEMRISDWSSDVCSSDLPEEAALMERHANYALVGIVSTVFLIASIVFVVWLGGSQFRRGHDLYRIMFVGPVRGLRKGGDVQFNGIKVGQIQTIRLDEDDPNRVLHDTAVDRGEPEKSNTIL